MVWKEYHPWQRLVKFKMLGYQILHSHKRSGMGRLGKVQRHTAQFQTLSKLRIQYVNLLMRRRKAQSDPARHRARSKCQRTGEAGACIRAHFPARKGRQRELAVPERVPEHLTAAPAPPRSRARLQPVQASLDAAAVAAAAAAADLRGLCRQRAGPSGPAAAVKSMRLFGSIVASAWRGVTRTASST